MTAVHKRARVAGAFTLIELIVVIVVLAILSGIAVPKYIDYTAKARESSVRGTLGGVRSAITNFYGNSAANSNPSFPTLAQVQTIGSVMQEAIPMNPFNNDASIAGATWAASPPVSGTNGWNYDAAVGRFWANSSTVSENTW